MTLKLLAQTNFNRTQFEETIEANHNFLTTIYINYWKIDSIYIQKPLKPANKSHVSITLPVAGVPGPFAAPAPEPLPVPPENSSGISNNSTPQISPENSNHNSPDQSDDEKQLHKQNPIPAQLEPLQPDVDTSVDIADFTQNTPK